MPLNEIGIERNRNFFFYWHIFTGWSYLFTARWGEITQCSFREKCQRSLSLLPYLFEAREVCSLTKLTLLTSSVGLRSVHSKVRCSLFLNNMWYLLQPIHFIHKLAVW